MIRRAGEYKIVTLTNAWLYVIRLVNVVFNRFKLFRVTGRLIYETRMIFIITTNIKLINVVVQTVGIQAGARVAKNYIRVALGRLAATRCHQRILMPQLVVEHIQRRLIHMLFGRTRRVNFSCVPNLVIQHSNKYATHLNVFFFFYKVAKTLMRPSVAPAEMSRCSFWNTTLATGLDRLNDAEHVEWEWLRLFCLVLSTFKWREFELRVDPLNGLAAKPPALVSVKCAFCMLLTARM